MPIFTDMWRAMGADWCDRRWTAAVAIAAVAAACGTPRAAQPQVRSSIDEVLKTLAEAVVLVILVIFVFLQNWRATVIPAVTIPVSLVGTFAFVKAFGFSINTLTLFGIVLATGLVVDDAIVVVENIARNLVRDGRAGEGSISSSPRCST